MAHTSMDTDVIPASDAREIAPVRLRQETGRVRHRFALLIGINRYVDPNIAPLRFCVNDVRALERRLRDLGYTVVAIHDEAIAERLRPTRDNIEAELARVCEAAGPDDLLLVHFACHAKLVDGHAVLITSEARLDTLAERALSLPVVERRLRQSRARRQVVLLDACHGGVELGRDIADPEFRRNVYDRAEGFVLIAASTARQVAQEWRQKQHGVFTYFLLEGLSGKADRTGKGFVTVDDVKGHVLDGLRRWSLEHGGLIQEPTVRSEGMGDIVLAELHRAPTRPRVWARWVLASIAVVLAGLGLWCARHVRRPPAVSLAPVPAAGLVHAHPPLATPAPGAPMPARPKPARPQTVLAQLEVRSEPDTIIKVGGVSRPAVVPRPGDQAQARFRLPVGDHSMTCSFSVPKKVITRPIHVRAGALNVESCYP